MITTLPLRRLCILLALALAPALAGAGPVLIANKNVASEKIDDSTLKAVLLGKKISWDGAGRVALAFLKAGAVADESLRKHADMTVSAFNNHWRRLAMTGGGTAPKSFEKEEELRKFVAETPGAIGFIDAANADGSVIVLPTVP